MGRKHGGKRRNCSLRAISPFPTVFSEGEIARYEQFFLFPQCFLKTNTADTLKPGLVWERVKQDIVKLYCLYVIAILIVDCY